MPPMLKRLFYGVAISNSWILLDRAMEPRSYRAAANNDQAESADATELGAVHQRSTRGGIGSSLLSFCIELLMIRIRRWVNALLPFMVVTATLAMFKPRISCGDLPGRGDPYLLTYGGKTSVGESHFTADKFNACKRDMNHLRTGKRRAKREL